LDWSHVFKQLENDPNIVALSSHTARIPSPPHSGYNFISLVLIRHSIDRLVSIYFFEMKRLDFTTYTAAQITRQGSLAEFLK
jgi:hypothetical protein